MEVFQYVLSGVLILASIVLIVIVLLQPGRTMGLGSISGGAETFFGKHKAKSFEGRLALATKIAAGLLVVLSIVLVIITK
ncbi:preprotein translocase subunit SecG [Gehongia tenuis]|uniref:Protein-export membrane protein SecG n=1 Tax=Gehongia tenuis TaxID=2763655 RepID=A0A926D337_9FIRM|nr:preprotein translocase subunit SecG [Gehongia tenuis]MBC8530398.1 preprotein translocase subunit SecG [Gehongia tenuis]